MRQSESLNEESFDLKALAHVAIRGSWIILAATVLCGGVAWGISMLQTPIYASTVKIQVTGGQTGSNTGSGDIEESRQLASSYSELIKTRTVMSQAIDDLGLERTVAAATHAIEVRNRANILLITASDPDPGTAADLANVVANVFIGELQQRQLAQIALFQAQLTQYGIFDQAALVTAQAAALTALTIVEDAYPTLSPSSPQVTLNIAVGLVLGILLGGVALWLRNQFDDRLRSSEEVAATLGIPHLGNVPIERDSAPSRAVLLNETPSDVTKEAYNFLQTSIDFALIARPGAKSILVTSSAPSEGKSTVVANLAVSLAGEGRQTIAIDCDLRRPSLQQLFAMQEGLGITHALLSKASLQDMGHNTMFPNLRVIPSGPIPPDPTQLIRSPKFGDLIEELRTQADIILIDSPPLLAVTDPTILAQIADVVVLVVDASQARRRPLVTARQTLDSARPDILGLVYNKSKPSQRYGYYSYPSTRD